MGLNAGVLPGVMPVAADADVRIYKVRIGSKGTTAGSAGRWVWVKPQGAKHVLIYCIGPGGGGGGGGRRPTIESGGGGGSGGGIAWAYYAAEDLPSQVDVTVLSGGAGGAAAASDNASGSGGASPSDTAFGPTATPYCAGVGGSGGTGGQSAGAASGGGAPSATTCLMPGGGGGGGVNGAAGSDAATAFSSRGAGAGGGGGGLSPPAGGTGLAGAHDSTDGTSFTTASISPTAGALVLIWVMNTVAANPTGTVDSVSGANMNFTQVNTVTCSNNKRRLTLLVAVSDGTSGALTIQLGATATACAWSVVQFTGTPTTNGGLDAIAQSVTGSSSVGGTTGLISLAAENSMSRSAVGWFHFANEATTPAANYTEIHDVSGGTPTSALETQWRSDAADTGTGASWATDADWAGIACEIKGSAYAGGQGGLASVSGAGGSATRPAGGAAGAAGTPGGNLLAGASAVPGSGGGGGGAGITGAAGAGGDAGYGAGGGGGGSAANGQTAGAGGAGGDGICVVISWR